MTVPCAQLVKREGPDIVTVGSAPKHGSVYWSHVAELIKSLLCNPDYTRATGFSLAGDLPFSSTRIDIVAIVSGSVPLIAKPRRLSVTHSPRLSDVKRKGTPILYHQRLTP